MFAPSLELQQLTTAWTVSLRVTSCFWPALSPEDVATISAKDASGNPQITRLLALSCVSTMSILVLRRLFSSLSSFTLPINFVISSLTADLISPGISSLIISLMDFKIFALILSAKWSIVASSNSSHFVFFRDISKVCRTTSVKQWIPNFKRKLLKTLLQVEF